MLNQYDWCLYQAGTCEKREPCTGGRRREKTEGTDNWLQTQETDLAQIFPSWLSEGANPAYTVIADLQLRTVKQYISAVTATLSASWQQPQQANMNVSELHSPLSILPSTTTPRPLGK